MKWIIHLLPVVALTYQVAAFPHNGHRDFENCKPKPVETVVYVDESGHTLGVEHVNPPTTLSTDLPTLLPAVDPAPLNLATPNSGTDTVAQPPQSDQHKRRFGVSYSPYNGDNTCRTQEQVNSDMDKLSQYAYVRIYGVDCDQTEKVVNAARKRDMKVFAGVFDLQDLNSALNLIIHAAVGDWSTFHTISIGNELINRGVASVPEVVAAVSHARKRLRTAGYTGPVVTIDTFSQMLHRPALCNASDYCAANCHAFFDGNLTPDKAGRFAREQARRLTKAHHGKRTVITESGWPHQGRPNRLAVPSPKNQQVAIASLRRAFKGDPDDLVLFSAFDDPWKQDGKGTFDAEKFWGIERR